jgi:hypothetical protein
MGTMHSKDGKALLHKGNSVLRPDGSFLVYQFSSTVLPYLEKSNPRSWHEDCPQRIER